MTETTSNRNELRPELTPGQRLKRAAIGVLIFLILLIPRVRRLRRRVRLWTGFRIAAGVAGLVLGTVFLSGGSTGFLVGGVTLALFALLIRATPVRKSLEDQARELGALVVLNGGDWIPPTGNPALAADIFAAAERLIVEHGGGRTLLEIPLAEIQSCAARAIELGEGKPWELEIAWNSPGPQTARFHFDGLFAEHLARVAETTIGNLRRKELPVLNS